VVSWLLWKLVCGSRLEVLGLLWGLATRTSGEISTAIHAEISASEKNYAPVLFSPRQLQLPFSLRQHIQFA
jgi:hypothetical protein